MQYRRLSGTGIKVSRVCLGTMTFGDQVDKQTGIEIVNRAVDLGVNFIDTANAYTNGDSERIVGEAIKPFREKIILATKCGYSLRNADMNDMGMSRRNILKSLDESLKRLGTDYIDVFYLHHPIYDVPLEEVVDTMTTLVRSGKIRYWGVSNQSSWQFCEEVWRAKAIDGVGPIVTQNPYNLLARGIENELVPFVEKYNLGLVVYNPIAGGLLSGKHSFANLTPETRFTGSMGEMYRERYWIKENFDAVEKLKTIAADNGMSLIDLALSWVASKSYVDAMLLGVTKMDHLINNIQALDREPISDDVSKICDELWFELSGKRFKYNR